MHAHRKNSCLILQPFLFLITGLSMGWITSLLWLYRLGHPDDHWETQAGRQRLHQTFLGPFHWLHAGFQESCCSSHAKGNAYIYFLILFYKMPRFLFYCTYRSRKRQADYFLSNTYLFTFWYFTLRTQSVSKWIFFCVFCRKKETRKNVVTERNSTLKRKFYVDLMLMWYLPNFK